MGTEFDVDLIIRVKTMLRSLLLLVAAICSQAHAQTSLYTIEAAAGRIGGCSSVNKFGRNPDIDSGTDEDIWDGGGDWVPPTVARTHDLASTDADDTSDGAGARTVEIYGLDSDYNEISEVVTLAGASDVETTNTYLRIHRMIVRTAGATGSNEGTITATANVDATVTAQINVGNNQTLMAIYTVPAGYTCFVMNYYWGVNKQTATAVQATLLVRPPGEVWQVKHMSGAHTQGSTDVNHHFGVPLKIDEKCDIRMRAGVTANNSDIPSGFDAILIKN